MRFQNNNCQQFGSTQLSGWFEDARFHSDGLSLNGASHMGRLKRAICLKTHQPISLEPGLKFSLNLKAKKGSVVSDKNI